MLFPIGKNGLWWYNAYVILSSADDVDKALAKNGLSIGKSSVKGSSVKDKYLIDNNS